MGTQTVMFDEIDWENTDPQGGPLTPTPPRDVRGAPAGLVSGMPNDSHAPYWEFTYQLTGTSGLVFSNIVARDTQSSGSTEDVFDAIEFTDLIITFDDGSVVTFDVARSFSNSSSRFVIAQNGHRRRPADPLFQRGLKLTLVDNVLSSSGGVCNIALELSAVFRGAKNDFDPGGVPVAMIVWPEIGWTWNNTDATKRVRKFQGSVKVTIKNKMAHGHGATPPNENVASLFTDSNTSMRDHHRPQSIFNSLLSWGGAIMGMPFGWAMVFDYVKLNLITEFEFVAVYGPGDGNFYRKTSWGSRDRNYIWPSSQILGPFDNVHVQKADRQGFYDNIHAPAKMPTNDRCGNVQIHAPFCGHSCVHLHWRWSNVSSNGSQSGPGWRYRGWSNPTAGTPQAYSTDNSPLVPPNQRIVVALCRPGAVSSSPSHIINTGAPGALDPLRKMIYYWAEVHNPNSGEKQVIYSHGIGWAYRYSLLSESPAVEGLTDVLTDSLPWTGTPTQHEIADFFMNSVYPSFRYMGGTNPCTNQVPEGNYDEDETQRNLFGIGSLPRISMESL